MSTSTTTTTDCYSTPGEILSEEFLEPLNISRYRLAKAINVSETAIGEIVMTPTSALSSMYANDGGVVIAY